MESTKLEVSEPRKRLGGRPKGSPNKPKTAGEIAHEMGYEPARAMVHIARDGAIVEPDGRLTPVTLEDRLTVLGKLAGFVHAKPQGDIHATVDHRHLHVDMTRIMMNPELAQAAETLALAMAEQDDAIDATFEALPAADEA